MTDEGADPAIPNSLTWCSNNIEGVYKRGVIVGIVVGWGNLNGVVSHASIEVVDLTANKIFRSAQTFIWYRKSHDIGRDTALCSHIRLSAFSAAQFSCI